METEQYYTLTEAAKLLRCDVQALRRAANRGQVQCVRTLGGWRRFPQSEIHRLMKQQKTEQPTPEA